MLALNINPGQFLAVGDAVIRIVGCGSRGLRTWMPVRVAIDTTANVRILRFDEEGNLLTVKSKVIGRYAGDDGHPVLALKCGHIAPHQDLVEAVECPACIAAAQPICQKVKALAALLAEKPEALPA